MQLPLAACWLSQTHCSSGKTLLLQLFLHHMGRFPDALPICKENWCFCLLLPLLFIAISLPQTPILPRSFSTSINTATKAVIHGSLFSLYPLNISLAPSSLLYHSLSCLILLSISFLVYIQMFIIKNQLLNSENPSMQLKSQLTVFL